MCFEKRLSEEGAELALANAHQLQAFAHRYLAQKAASHDEDERERLQSLAEEMFDLAETDFATAFNANSVHLARYTEDAKPYKLVIGAMFEAVQDDAILLRCLQTLCRLHEIDPFQMHEMYLAWQDGSEVC